MMKILTLFFFFLFSLAQPQATDICFTDKSCVNLRDDAPIALRTNFPAVCKAAPLWRAINCAWFSNATVRILNISASDAHVPDFTAVLMYSRGGALWTDGANALLRANNGLNVPVAWKDSLVLTGSGLRQLALRQHSAPVDIVWRSEPAYAGAPCVWGNGLPVQEWLAPTVTVSGFTSTTTSLPFAKSWPFGAGATRILALFRANATRDGGVFLGWLESPFQYEVTFPPPIAMNLLACDRRTLASGQKIAVMSAIVDVVGAPVPSQALRASAYKQLRAAFDNELNECDELWCRFSCANRVPPVSCACDTSGTCSTAGLSGLMRIVNTDWIVGPGAWSRPVCLTVLDGNGDGQLRDAVGFSECSTASNGQRQAFVFQTGSAGTLIRYRNATGLCLSQFGAKYYAGAELRLWTCGPGGDQNFALETGWNELRIVSTRASPPTPRFCLNFVALDVVAQFLVCQNVFGNNEIVNALPFENSP
jgi:hypothetical protein